MTIIIKNFGPIKEFSFGLSKDLIMIYGENNIGKSYAISLVYLILKNLMFESLDYDGLASRGHMLLAYLPCLEKDKRYFENIESSIRKDKEITY